MIIYYPHIMIIKENGQKNKASKLSKPRVKIKCDNCGKEFIEKEQIFNKRIKLINKEFCGKCARPLVNSIAGIKSNYNENGSLKENSGRFNHNKWINLSEDERKKVIERNKKNAIDFHKYLNDNLDIKQEHYKKVFQNSRIGYVSNGQLEIFNILKDYGYKLDGIVLNMKVDIINKEKFIVIEYNGDFWHCNPIFWNKEDYNDVIKMTAGEKWNLDRRRRFELRKLGYNIYTIWENDWLNDRNKILKLLNKITDNKYIFKKWEFKKSLPLKGRTYEDIYGIEKAKILKNNISKIKIGKKINKKIMYEIITPNQGIFYVSKITQWHKKVKNSHSIFVKYNNIEYDKKYKLWDEKEFTVNTNIKCTYCGIVGSPINMKRYHFDNCKKNIKNIF